MIIGSRQRLRATTENQIIEVCIEGKKITRVAESKSLGVYIDETLSWKKHMKELSKKIASGIGALKRLMPFISKDTAVIIYKALIEHILITAAQSGMALVTHFHKNCRSSKTALQE